eukprot:gene5810-biopygen11782
MTPCRSSPRSPPVGVLGNGRVPDASRTRPEPFSQCLFCIKLFRNTTPSLCGTFCYMALKAVEMRGGGTEWHGTARNNTGQYGTAPNNTEQHGTTRHNTEQHRTARNKAEQYGARWSTARCLPQQEQRL